MSSYEDDRQREGAEERDQDQQRKDVLDQDEKMKGEFLLFLPFFLYFFFFLVVH